MPLRRLRHGLISALVLVVLLAGQGPASAASTIISVRNASDPRARVFDGQLYLYTSSDMNQGGNWPMNKTYGYALKDVNADPGLASSWVDHGDVLSESVYGWSAKQNHLWAPDAFQGKDGKIYLYVPDTYGSNDNSRIGVSVASSPMGPFAPPAGLTNSTNYLPDGPTGYMSDPSVFADPNDPNGQRYLVYADGDYNSGAHGCGHVSIAKLDPTASSYTAHQKVVLSNAGGMPSAGGCSPAYIEGPELGYFGGPGTDGNGKYFLYFAMKDNTSYTESIGYATADTIMGPYTYQGLIMNGQGGSGWTNQASIVEWHGHYLLFYHNDPRGGANPQRQVFLECLAIKNGKITAATRGGYTTLDACPQATTGTGGAGGGGTGGGGGAGGGAGGGRGGGTTTGGDRSSSGGHAGGASSTGGTATGGWGPAATGGASSPVTGGATGGRSDATGGTRSGGTLGTSSGGRPTGGGALADEAGCGIVGRPDGVWALAPLGLLALGSARRRRRP